MANPRDVMRVWRSLLFAPGHRSDRFQKALDSGADAVVLDLEDAVAVDAKADARQQVVQSLSNLPADRPRLVRLNAITTRFGLLDLVALSETDARPAAIVLPKVESPDEPAIAAAAFGERGIPVVAIIESVRGLAAVDAIAAAPAVTALGFGAADFAAQLGVTMDAAILAHARSRIVLAATSSRCASFDVPCLDVRDSATNERDAQATRSWGFTGKFAIHPGQIAAIHAAFRPSTSEIAQAETIVAASEAASGGVVALDGRMIDEPVVRSARSVLARVARDTTESPR